MAIKSLRLYPKFTMVLNAALLLLYAPQSAEKMMPAHVSCDLKSAFAGTIMVGRADMG